MAKATTTAAPDTVPSHFDAAAFYTVNITLHNATVDEMRGIQYRNFQSPALDRMVNKIFTHGFVYRVPVTGTIELISPFNIQSVVIMEQKEGKL